jgi:hypothetical protein
MDFISNDSFTIVAALDTTAVGSATGPLVGAVVRLFQANITPDKETSLATLNADSCTFVGYAEKAITWQLPSIADDGAVEVVGTTTQFRPTNSVTPNSAYGAYIVSAAGDLAFAGRFDGAPLPMADAQDQITVTVRYRPIQAGLGVVVS